jgi:hypothetical protein
LQSVFAFHFYHIEQYQLFLFDRCYVLSSLEDVGGCCRLAGEFLLQFFIYPYAGAMITSAVLTLVSLLTHLLIKRIDKGAAAAFFLSLLPMYGLLFVQLDFNYFMQGTAAYLLALALLIVYAGLDAVWQRPAFSVVATFVLFYAGGSIAILFALTIFVAEFFPRQGFPHQSFPNKSFPQRSLSLIPCAEACLLAFLSVRYAFVGEYRFAFLPDRYYLNSLTPPGILIYLPWALLPLTVALTTALRSRRMMWLRRPAGIVAQAVLAGALLAAGIKTWGDMRSLRYKEMEYYCRTGQPDKVIEMNRGNVSNCLYLCMLNLSLAEKGMLADSLFCFDQRGTQSLFIPMNNTQTAAMLLSDIYYVIGHTGAAQQMAFEASVSAPGHRIGRMLQRLVETNLIYGVYPVAGKYLKLLEKTVAYRRWAREMRKYLDNDEAVNRHPEYGKRRRSLPADPALFTAQVSEEELIRLSLRNPENRNPVEYAGAMYLLMKNTELFMQFLDRYYATEALPLLPRSFQEGVIIACESEGEEVWERKGVSKPVIARFRQYRAFILANRHRPHIADFVKASYGDTYWFYYMFK